MQILKSKLKYLQILAFDILDPHLLDMDIKTTQGLPVCDSLKKMFVLNAIMIILGHGLYCKYAFMTEGFILFIIKLRGLLWFYLENSIFKKKKSHYITILLKNRLPLRYFPQTLL